MPRKRKLKSKIRKRQRKKQKKQRLERPIAPIFAMLRHEGLPPTEYDQDYGRDDR